VIVGLDLCVVVRHQHFVTAHDRTDRRAPRQLDLVDQPADDARLACLAVRYGFDGLGRTAP